ncbi:hypothetical protein JTE90_001679 [Oedothorax gibbosus]|uniref:Cation/H+ exchanger transmembrane domain-containing protein n=1 Tax=Oedothorax gibbosus TaxID=931172 RepID=A0AAV6UJ46_9ARAC|nr:hypothetical protein JTE90_001679 [Oedothorax gibbosus]
MESSISKQTFDERHRNCVNEECNSNLAPESPAKCFRLTNERWKLVQAQFLTFILLLLFICASLYGILEEDILPGSELFALLLLALSAYISGVVANYVHLPPLIGMLIAGFLFRNLHVSAHLYENISIRWATTLRSTAFVIILLKAGLGLDADKLKKLSLTVFQLALTPCIVETAAAAVASHFFLGLPWVWSIMLGFVISAVSPAVIVPGLLNLQNKCFGTAKGIPTLVIAAASLDDIICITGFSVMLSVSFSEGNLLITILKGVLEPVGGLLLGVIFGRIFWHLPNSASVPSNLVYYRVLLLCFGGFASMFVSKRYDVAGVGPMACLVLAFVAAFGWKRDQLTFDRIEKVTGVLWTGLQPFLFSLIGSEVSIADLQFNLGNTILSLAIALGFRIVVATFVTFGSDLNIKEKIFIAFAWIPKATVQAAVGPQALDYVLSNSKGQEMEKYAQMVLTAAVVSIIMTAPVGAFLISVLGPILLSNDRNPDKQRSENMRLQTVDSDVL